MDTTEEEKDWLRRISGQKPTETAEKRVKKVAKEAVEQKTSSVKKKGNGFDDVAGMNELKQRVTEGFINVLRNRECAETYGIKPPSMLFYGPAGCGKTFFAEKMAEEIGINFVKIVPDDLPALGFTAHNRRLERCSRMQRKTLPPYSSLMSLMQWCHDVRVKKVTNIMTARSMSFSVCSTTPPTKVSMFLLPPIILSE